MDRVSYDLNRIITAAASLSDRIEGGVYGSSAIDPDLAASRLAAWCEKSAQGNSRKFDRRLSWEGIDTTAALRLLGSDPLELRPAPFWAPLLGEMLACLTEPGATPADASDEESLALIPFAHAFAPLVAFGMRRLEDQVTAALLPEPVAACLRFHLLKRVGGVCTLTLGEEFLRFRKDRGWNPGDGEGRNELYTAFIDGLRKGGLVRVFVRYPVLARLVATAIAHWLDDMGSFLLRFDADRPGIARRFFESEAPAAVRSIQCSLSDRHRGGLSVKIIGFEDGQKIVYKPKSLAIDAAWAGLVDWLGQREPAVRLRAPLTWNRGEYGWVEYIEHSACDSIAAVRNFYRRAGMLTCLFYAVHATDFHYENLIAARDQPVPIDLETLFVPQVKALAGQSERVNQRYLGTVLQSLMLPNWMPGLDNKTAFDISGLGSFAQDQDGASTLSWFHINSDAMQFAAGIGKVPASRNLPSLPGQAVDPGDFVPEIAEGFEQAYLALLRRRPALLDPAGPLEAFRPCSSRIVMRATRIYAALLRRSLTPRLLRNGIDRSLEFEGLSRPMLAQAGDYEGDRLFRAEVSALERLDVPYFDAATESDAISAGSGWSARRVLAGPSFDAVSSRLRALCPADLAYQLELIRSSFAARNLSPSWRPEDRTADFAGEALSPGRLLAEAETIASRVATSAIWEGDSAYWIGLDYNAAIQRRSLQPIGPSLYSGRGGIAVFLAALHAVGGNPEHRRLARGAARSIWRDWLSPETEPETTSVLARAQGIGGASGTAGVVYSLVATARLLGEPEVLDDALRISRLITPRDIAADESFDVVAGAGGAILGLLPLWNETRDSTVLDRITQCAEHLVHTQVQQNGGAGGWRTPQSTQPLTGFSHGAAGVAYALLRAHAATGVPAFRTAARRALDYERSAFLPSQRNWRDFRTGSPETACGGTWCHGAPGIGLARLGGMAYDDDEETRTEVNTAIRWLQATPPRMADHLCCGEFGNLELFLAAGQRLGRADLMQRAQILGTAVIARADHKAHGHRNGFQTNLGPCESIFIPGLFDGLAGIGYQMLRLAAPDRVPSVLLWE